jgi:hypothetical protein
MKCVPWICVSIKLIQYAKLKVSTLSKNKKTLPNGADSDHFMMPLIVSDKSLHAAGASLNEFDLIFGQRYALAVIDDAIIKEFSPDQILYFNDCLLETLKPGEEIDDNVCGLRLKW